MLCILEKISPSELVSNNYNFISNYNKVRCPRPKFKVSFYLYFCCFWISVTQINFENIRRIIQRIISDSCFQLKSWFNVDARAPSIPLLNFPFNIPGYVFEVMFNSIINFVIAFCKFRQISQIGKHWYNAFCNGSLHISSWFSSILLTYFLTVEYYGVFALCRLGHLFSRLNCILSESSLWRASRELVLK